MSADEGAAPRPTAGDQNDVRSPKGRRARVTIAAPQQPSNTEELVVSTPNQRNWRGILIALLVIVAVLGLILFSIVLVSPPEEGPRFTGRRPGLAQVLGPALQPRAFNGTWISDAEFVYKDAYGGISVYNAWNRTSRLLMTNTTFRQLNVVDFKVSSDLKYVLLIADVVHVYKYTTLARYYVVETATRNKFPLSYKDDDDTAPLLQYATWSPDGIAVAFVYENDVYYKPRVNASLICRITASGKAGVIYNGVPDWLYENEILHTDHSLWFSSDGKFLMYVTYNDTEVGNYQFPWYDSKNVRLKYPKIKSIRYPKVETPNPDVSVWVVNLKRPKYLFPFEVKPTNSVEAGSYITSVNWYTEHSVAIVYLNRRQNMSVITVCKSPGFNCTNFHVEKEDRGWTEPILHPVFSRDGEQCLARLPVDDGEKREFMHACHIQGGSVTPVTHGMFELTKILAWDEDAHVIYVIATSERNPGQRHLYKIGDTNSSVPWTCLTCAATADPDAYGPHDANDTAAVNGSLLLDYKCGYNSVVFSASYSFYVHECQGPDVPVVFLVETATNYRIAVLDAASSLRRRIGDIAVPQLKHFVVEIEYKYKAQVKLFYPPGLREHEDITFPLVLVVDAKPGSQLVSEKWEVTWPWYLASNRNFIVAQIDAGGSGFQGVEMRREIMFKLGSVEVTDQLAVLAYIIETFKFIDRSRVCVIGTGYGGYVSAMMLTQDYKNIINCSVSISPIASWQFYNSYFTERYMGFLSEQILVYEKADLTKKAGNLMGRQYMLVHGTADTSVKPQHAMMLARALVDQGVLFRQLMYPDEGHKFHDTQTHLYLEIDQFFNDSFGPLNFDGWESDGLVQYLQHMVF